MERKEAYEQIKKLGLQEKCKVQFGKNFTQCKTNELEYIIDSFNKNKVKEAILKIRGGNKVEDRNPEEKYEVLQKYGRDLTDEVAKGKIDPIIGRDEEIRRVIQILSRKSKNNPVLIGETGIRVGRPRRIVLRYATGGNRH